MPATQITAIVAAPPLASDFYQTYLSRVETGKAKPTLNAMEIIANGSGLSCSGFSTSFDKCEERGCTQRVDRTAFVRFEVLTRQRCAVAQHPGVAVVALRHGFGAKLPKGLYAVPKLRGGPAKPVQRAWAALWRRGQACTARQGAPGQHKPKSG